MTRPTRLLVEPSALLHNLAQIKRYAPNKKVVAMVKANAYGCGVKRVAPVLDGLVDALGVACLEEAMIIRALGVTTPCILFQGIFSSEELHTVVANQFACVIHQPYQLQWILNTPLPGSLQIWVKVNTGMQRLGFTPSEVPEIINALQQCSWVNSDIGLMTHMACADEPDRIENYQQIKLFEGIDASKCSVKSMANSAAIISFPQSHADYIRPGIMLYGVSPLTNHLATDLGLLPVMRFMSAVSAIHHYPPKAAIGYGATWQSDRASIIGIIPAGYGDGYPRHIAPKTPVWIQGREVPIVGRVSMDMMAVDLTDHPSVLIGDAVELWGTHILVERIAQASGTIGYELLCQISERVHRE